MKNPITMLLFAMITFTSAAHGERLGPLDSESIVLLYESRADTRISDEKIVETMSTEYQNAPEEFTRYDLMRQIAPEIKTRLAEALEITTVGFLMAVRLEEYDFEESFFPITIPTNSFLRLDESSLEPSLRESLFVPSPSHIFKNNHAITFSHGYGIKFTNGHELETFPVPFAIARTIAEGLAKSRYAFYLVTGEIVGVELIFDDLKSLEIRIIKIEAFYEPSGAALGVKEVGIQ